MASGEQGYRGTRLQGYKVTGEQGYRVTGEQGYRVTGKQDGSKKSIAAIVVKG
jgi:hypothetical protein